MIGIAAAAPDADWIMLRCLDGAAVLADRIEDKADRMDEPRQACAPRAPGQGVKAC